MKRDAGRVATLTRRLSAANEVGEDFKTDLQYGIEVGDYFAEVGVGTPPQTQTLLIDTGSDILWVQCQPCDKCYQALDPVFDPKASASFADVACDDSSLVCAKVEKSKQGCDDSDRCTYKISYGDGTETLGTMALENITIGGTTVPNVPIGCTHKSEGLSGGLIGGVFSYCLGIWSTGSAGWLGFGQTYVPTGANWSSLIHNQAYPSFYYIDLVGLRVGEEELDIPEGAFQVDPGTGEGGVVLDTGTVVTRLPKATYKALRDKFKEKMTNFATTDGVENLDTCYNLDGVDLNTIRVPTVWFTFSSQGFDPPNITLEAKNVLYVVDVTKSTYCLTFAQSPNSLSIIGSMHLEGIQITIESVGGYVGFGPGSC
ncbi:protein aspartic protease in guard cell 2 [Phtheirospermum japonicum]|uniref:Protein aspartic protease in guard cell 2 n=1 Tax=Phtheirospermum japonicum TaxID=374723 RepID=A0A830CKF5_9LAMI|nr:protein aspartic protease in guard cell 2 [Phtheirospermum japonicum]